VAEPNREVIAKINKLYFTNFIVLWTARRDKLIPVTIQWARKNGVCFHAISNHKCACDLMIDDKAVRPDELVGGEAEKV